MDIYHIEALQWESSTTVLKYETETSTKLNSDRYIKGDYEERPPNTCNTFLLKTPGGKYWSVTFYSDPARAHDYQFLTEEEAVNLWGYMTSNGDSPDKVAFGTAFSGYTINPA